ncbi:MAG: hypothetical protein QUV07_02095 [Cyanobium sp. CZS 25K]|nr:hypothetical protein [Cyanobium sp. CZS25K]
MAVQPILVLGGGFAGLRRSHGATRMRPDAPERAQLRLPLEAGSAVGAAARPEIQPPPPVDPQRPRP